MTSYGLEGRIEEDDRLLPGLPDDVTISRIAAKLPCREYRILSSLSRGWNRAISSRLVYGARVRSQSMVVLFALLLTEVKGADLYIVRVCLSSLRDQRHYLLPPAPDPVQQSGWISQKRMPHDHCIAVLDGKLYVLAGSSGNVYVLDIGAGRRWWRRCANMKSQRRYFGCNTLDGKIYVFGGLSENGPLFESDMYDPETDAWCSITPGPQDCRLLFPKVTTVGKELFIHSGRFWSPGREPPVSVEKGPFAYVYHPPNDEWRCVRGFTEGDSYEDMVFVLRGKVHKMNRLMNWHDAPMNRFGLYVYDVQANSWRHLQSFSFDAFTGIDYHGRPTLIHAFALGDTILVVLSWTSKIENSVRGHSCTITSQRLSVENEQIVWQKENDFQGLSHFRPGANPRPSVCQIQI